MYDRHGLEIDVHQRSRTSPATGYARYLKGYRRISVSLLLTVRVANAVIYDNLNVPSCQRIAYSLQGEHALWR